MLGSRQQGNDGILYDRCIFIPKKGSRVFMLGSLPQGNDGILYNIFVILKRSTI
jgi:hypothetical protein